jgi:hypothetical protein
MNPLNDLSANMREKVDNELLHGFVREVGASIFSRINVLTEQSDDFIDELNCAIETVANDVCNVKNVFDNPLNGKYVWIKHNVSFDQIYNLAKVPILTCPKCGKKSVNTSEKHHIWKCFSCGAGGTKADLFYELADCESRSEVIEILYSTFKGAE